MSTPTTTATEHLTTGWEADLDLDDTLLRRYVFALAATDVGPAAAMDGRVLRRDEVIAADLGRPNGLFNAAVLTQPLSGRELEETLATVEDHYAGGTGRVYLWSPWPTPDLRHRGWELDGHPPLLVRPPGTPLPPGHDELEIREVTDRRSLDDLARVLVDGFPFGELQPFDPGAWLDARLLDLPDHRMFVGYADGDAVAAGWLLLHGPLGALVLAATLPAARRRGYWSAMLRHRIEAADGRVVASIFGDMSRPGAERYGFLPLLRFTLWHRDRGSDLGSA